ncbi:hypothetical protein BDB01DRAFT_733943 [Pilobolus umbonatus]|nr:hypothetical protein BDB01DRAFT_733943 [Pilobolus umbonatus]
MFINNIKLNEFFKLTDCMCFDGLYNNVLNEIIVKYNNIGLNISQKHFCYPIKKEKNKDLDYDQLNFNNQLGTYNIQLKLSIVLYNIKHFVKINKIEEKDYYKLWLDDNFDFYTNIDSFNTISDLTPISSYKRECMNEMKDLQNDFINFVLNEGKNRIRGQKNKMQIDNQNNQNVNFEIQYIIQHRKMEDGKYEYEVKWRNYRKQYNTWVHEKDFGSIEIIKNYWNTI